MCRVTLEKLNVGRLQWIDLNNSEMHLVYRSSEFRGQFVNLRAELGNIERNQLFESTLKIA
jgi:hypothetical protein